MESSGFCLFSGFFGFPWVSSLVFFDFSACLGLSSSIGFLYFISLSLLMTLGWVFFVCVCYLFLTTSIALVSVFHGLSQLQSVCLALLQLVSACYDLPWFPSSSLSFHRLVSTPHCPPTGNNLPLLHFRLRPSGA